MRALRAMTLTAGAFCLAASGCGGTDRQPEMPDPTVVDRSADDMGLPPVPEESQPQGSGSSESSGGEEETAEVADAPPRPPVLLVVGENAPIEGLPPTVRIAAPRNGQRLSLGSATLRVDATNWPLQPDPGRHLHVIVDDEPYIPVRDISQPIDLLALVRNSLGHELAEGTHVLRVFPSRGHHESVKTAGAFVTTLFHYGRPTPGFTFDPAAPLLTYSRPKGCNRAGRILLDFYVSNTELSSDGTRVHYELDGGAVAGDIVRWLPHWFENLPVGEHQIVLTLIGPSGEPIAGPFNRATRTFRVAEQCP
jgi:hypothetical protein